MIGGAAATAGRLRSLRRERAPHPLAIPRTDHAVAVLGAPGWQRSEWLGDQAARVEAAWFERSHPTAARALTDVRDELAKLQVEISGLVRTAKIDVLAAISSGSMSVEDAVALGMTVQASEATSEEPEVDPITRRQVADAGLHFTGEPAPKSAEPQPAADPEPAATN